MVDMEQRRRARRERNGDNPYGDGDPDGAIKRGTIKPGKVILYMFWSALLPPSAWFHFPSQENAKSAALGFVLMLVCVVGGIITLVSLGYLK